MATTKNAILRFNTLDKCFRNFGRKYYFDDLLEKVNEVIMDYDPSCTGVKTRQLRDDIRFMKSDAGYSAPIFAYKEEKKAYYRYEDKDFSINNSPLNDTEAEQLRNAISVLQRFDGAPQFEWINEIGPMLDTHFGLSDSRKIMSYDTNIDYAGYEYITQIFNAILNKRVLKIDYEPFGKQAFKLEFHPYYLKQYNNRWFVFGLNKELGVDKWNLALDRIQEINEVDIDYIDSEIDWEDHFFDMIGVTTPENGFVQEIELLFSAEQANYIKTKPLHPTQKDYVQENGELLVRLNLIPNYELEMKLLSFADKVKVISPEVLKNKIINRLKLAIKKY
jgi:predicted DNA-binding transcriptional regulator YafY